MKTQFVFSLMNKAAAEMIQAWHYEGAYAVYNMGNDEGELAELLDRRSPYYSVRDEQAGFQSVRVFLQHNIHGKREFLEMCRDA